MPQKVIKFTGINRRVNEFQSSGACEELINLRPTQIGANEVIKNKLSKDISGAFKKVYEHSWGNYKNYIVVDDSGGLTHIDFDTKKSTTLTTEFSSSDIELSSAGNVLLAYSELEGKQLAFKFKDDAYKSYDFRLPHINRASVTYEYDIDNPPVCGVSTPDATSAESLKTMVNDALMACASKFYGEYENGLCGAALIGCTYELEDGTEIWSTAFIVADITRYDGFEAPWIDKNGLFVKVYGAKKVMFSLSYDDRETQGFKRFNIYATRPVFKYTSEFVVGGGQNQEDVFVAKETPLADFKIDGQLMYYQGSIDLGETSLVMNFGSSQAGERVMDVTAGCVTRVGNTVSYNNRFHYYKSTKNHVIQSPTTSSSFMLSNGQTESNPTDSYPSWIAYVKFEHGWKMVDGIYSISDTLPCDYVYPLMGVKQIAFVKGEWESGSFSVPYSKMFYVTLKDSSSYNYSCAFDVIPNIVDAGSFGESMRAAGQFYTQDAKQDELVFLEKEYNAINVTAPFNPYAFPVKYSYSLSGEVIDVTAAFVPISTTQIGQYPLTIFTTNGIFSMEQGDGSTLYSNVIPLQPMIAIGKACVTPIGTFFISSKSLYLLSGREAANLSYILNGERELTLRENVSFQKLYCGNSEVLFNFAPMLSGEDFEDFISNASMTYDQMHNELYISSNDASIPYSYVFNIDKKSYFKASKRYIGANSGARHVVEAVGTNRQIVDLHTEEDAVQPIFLQSRPMPFETFNTHIQRLILLADAKLTGNQNLCISVFASDNLNDWKCIISAQKQKTVLRQIRTNRAAKSYRDYVIIISGTVDTDTDISDLIADYTVVSRRLG